MKTLNVFAIASVIAARALIALALGAACTVTYADTYQYDERGDLETLTTPRGVRTYQYDEVQRLKIEQGYTGNREHDYDRNGNRATDGATAPGSPSAATYTPNTNRIVTINGAAVSIDAAGQITNDGVNTYTWDDAGRLKTMSRAGQLRATYHYDHKHRRTRKVTTAAAPQGVQTIRYHYDDRDRLMAETTGTGAPLRSYIWADDTLLAIAEHAAQTGNPSDIRMLYLELDHLGTPRQARRDGGAIVWRWESDGYGTSPANEDPDGNGLPTTVNLRFPGQYYDEESGLHYNWHRYYVPRLGRYLSSDPIGLAGDVNTYAYVGGNPVSRIDPTGELWMLAPALAGLGASAGGSAAAGGISWGSAVLGGFGLAALMSIPGDSPVDQPSRELWWPARETGQWVCKARADCNDNIPGNCPENPRNRFAFGGGAARDLGTARNIAKANATANLACQPKHVSCKCTGPKGEQYSGGC